MYVVKLYILHFSIYFELNRFLFVELSIPSFLMYMYVSICQMVFVVVRVVLSLCRFVSWKYLVLQISDIFQLFLLLFFISYYL